AETRRGFSARLRLAHGRRGGPHSCCLETCLASGAPSADGWLDPESIRGSILAQGTGSRKNVKQAWPRPGKRPRASLDVPRPAWKIGFLSRDRAKPAKDAAPAGTSWR